MNVTSPRPDQRSWRPPFAVVVIGVLGASLSVIMPTLLGSFATSRGLTAAQLSTVASAELAGMTIATLLVGFVIGRMRRSSAARAALVLSASMHLLASWDLGYAALLAARLMAGVGEGALLALAVASAAALRSPDRAYGLLLATNMIWSSIVFASAPYMPRVADGPPVLIVMALLSFAALPAAAWLPGGQTGRGMMSSATGGVARGPAIGGLAATLILFTGIGCVWPLMERLAATLGVSAARASMSLSAATLCGVAAGLSASWLGVRAGRLAPIAAGTLGVALAMTVLATAGSAATYTALACLLMACWIFTTPYYTGLLAALDPTGRLAALSMTAQFLGMALGSGLAGAVAGVQPHPRVEYLGAALAATALVLIVKVGARGMRGSLSAI